MAWQVGREVHDVTYRLEWCSQELHSERSKYERRSKAGSSNVGLALTAIVMFAAAILLFYGLATGQGG